MFGKLFGKKKPKAKEIVAETYRSALGDAQIEKFDGARLVKFERDGDFDYNTYRAVQNEANALKLDNQWVSEDQIKHLAQTVLKYRAHPKFALCQGTRRGLEQKWFRESLPGTDVLGTDIADSATQFPHTVQWDFHEMNPDWSGRADFVYSNSWDHAYDPQKAFRAWYDALVVGGVILLDHSDRHEPDAATEMDPFGATLSGLRTMFESLFGSKGQVEEVQTGMMPGVCTFVFQKTE